MRALHGAGGAWMAVALVAMSCADGTSSGGGGEGAKSPPPHGCTPHAQVWVCSCCDTDVPGYCNDDGTAVDCPTCGPCGDPCADGSDCSRCADYNACATCEKGNHPQGAMVFDELITCTYCAACYTVCDGASNGCTVAPTTMDACDQSTPDPMGAGCYDGSTTPASGCLLCAEAGTCKPQVDACMASADCVAFNAALQACPTN